MKFNKLAICAVVAATVAACNKEDISVPDVQRQTLTASVEVSKLNFAEATNNLAVTWSEGDKITIFSEEGNKVADFILTSGASTASAIFELEAGDSTLRDSTNYIAVYPGTECLTLAARDAEGEEGQLNRVVNDYSDIDENCHMKSTSFQVGDNIAFAHEKAIVAINLTSSVWNVGDGGSPYAILVKTTSQTDSATTVINRYGAAMLYSLQSWQKTPKYQFFMHPMENATIEIEVFTSKGGYKAVKNNITCSAGLRYKLEVGELKSKDDYKVAENTDGNIYHTNPAKSATVTSKVGFVSYTTESNPISDNSAKQLLAGGNASKLNTWVLFGDPEGGANNKYTLDAAHALTTELKNELATMPDGRLIDIVLPDASWGYSFEGLANVSSLILPSMADAKPSMFADCPDLKVIKIGVSKIPAGMFDGCNKDIDLYLSIPWFKKIDSSDAQYAITAETFAPLYPEAGQPGEATIHFTTANSELTITTEGEEGYVYVTSLKTKAGFELLADINGTPFKIGPLKGAYCDTNL